MKKTTQIIKNNKLNIKKKIVHKNMCCNIQANE